VARGHSHNAPPTGEARATGQGGYAVAVGQGGIGTRQIAPGVACPQMSTLVVAMAVTVGGQVGVGWGVGITSVNS